ncbi:disease resistance protein RGA2-like [Curcuma longa]|uniref:disease resistance protein RGA2-like n=1 Tax=Curcuma longa TaxID=136217 RepID=UPI003D9DFA2A
MAFLDVRRILFDMLPSPAIVEQGRALGVARQLESIRLHLRAINAVTMDAELRGQEDWMATVGTTMVDLEVLLTRIADWHETASDRWTSGPFLGLCASFRLACKLRKMVRRLRALVAEASALNLREDTMQSMDPLREDYSDILKEEVLGRDGDRDEIVKRIQRQKPKEEDKFGHAPPCVIVIYGPRGMGKTTLARMVYHHDWVRRCFRHRIWVDVSDLFSFDMVRVNTEIARSVAGGGACMKLQSHLQSISEYVLEALAGDRYLLVLDGIDVKGEAADFETSQSKLTQKWDQMTHQIFSVGAPGSTIIVTVADQYQAEIFKSATTHNLTALSENDWLDLFKKHAIKNRPGKDEETAAAACTEHALLPFLRGRYEEYSGSPLEAKLLGTAFRHTEVKQWRREIIDLGLLNRSIRENQHYSMASFHHLPTRSARLQLYCSLFPELKRVTPLEDFIHMMLVEGLVPDSGDRDDAIRYLKNNVVAAFHQQLTRGQHYFTWEVGQEYSSRIPKQCRHLCLLLDSNAPISATVLLQGATKLRTLILRTTKNMQQKHQKYQFADLPEDIFLQLAYLRILHLADSKIQTLPRAIEKLSDLRYLNLSNSEIVELPGSLCSLRNLQVLKLAHCKMLLGLPGEIHKLQKLRILKLAHCEKLQKLPDSVTSLVNLQELNVKGCCFLAELPEDFSGMQNLTELNMQECASLIRVPRGIEQLSELRRLLGYSLVHPIGTWVKFTSLKQLWLEKLEHDMAMQNIVRTKLLQQITNLEDLALHWQWSERSDAANNDIQLDSLILLDLLEPRDGLKKLEIFSYFGVAYPKWMEPGTTSSLNNLAEIRLVNLKACISLPPLGHLPRLQIAVISGMEKLVMVSDSFYAGGKFLRLRELTFSEMPNLRIWNTPVSEDCGKEENEEYFPLLKELTLFQCPKLKELNVFLGARRLKMSLSNGLLLASQIQKSWDNLKHLEELEIVGCQELERLPAAMAKLKYLRKLTIIWCNNLVSLPNWLLELRYLSRLQVSDCPNLSWMPQGLKQQKPGIAISVHDCPNLQRY